MDRITTAVPELDCTTKVYCFTNTLTCDEITPKLAPLMIQLQDNYYTLPSTAYTFPRGYS